MSFLDEAIYERDNSIERDVIGGDSDNEKNPFDVLGDSDDENKKPGEVIEKVEPKTTKRRISTQPRLNPERLTGARGIHKIEDEFKNVKFKGKGHEVQDLDMIMKRLSHWAHRLFPKNNFDDTLLAIETQGKKKVVQHFMNKYRTNTLDDDIVRNTIESDDENENRESNQTVGVMEPDEFDQMLSEQISKTTNNFDQTMDSDLGVRQLDQTTASSMSQSISQPKTGLTDEQKKRIEENRLRALELRKKRLMRETQSTSQINNEENTTIASIETTSNATQNFANQEIDLNDLIPVQNSEPLDDDIELMREMEL